MEYEEYFDRLRDRRVAVIGLGVSNLPLAEELLKRGVRLTVCDRRSGAELGETYSRLASLGCEFRLGEDYLERLDYDVIFRTPGLHPRYLSKAPANAVITSEMEAFFSLCPCRTIAVTGSDGKTTTSTVIAELLRSEGRTVHLGGNIGHPLLTDIPHTSGSDIAVLELSSFQLHGMMCCPDTAVVTNVSPNHLDVHPSYEDYIGAKENIFLHQTGGCRLVLNLDNEITASFAAKAKARVSFFSRRERTESGCCCLGGRIYRDGDYIMDAKEILVPGEHNVENFLAAFAAVDGLVSAETCRRVAQTFAGVEHRIQLIRTLRGVRYYNDSIASSPTRTAAGLRSFDRKVILIAGGHDKNVPFDSLAREILLRVKALFLTGETAEKIKLAVLSATGYDPSALPIAVIDDFGQAVAAAAEYASEGDIVILSPACSSFDKFKNFAERGNTFAKIVNSLK